MKFERPNTPEELEAQVTALLLGELSPEEAARVRSAIEREPELAEVHDRLEATIQLVSEAIKAPESSLNGPEPLVLRAEKRAALLDSLRTTPIPPRPARARDHWNLSLAIAALFVILLGVSGLLLPTFSKPKSKAQQVTLLAKQRAAELERSLGVAAGEEDRRRSLRGRDTAPQRKPSASDSLSFLQSVAGGDDERPVELQVERGKAKKLESPPERTDTDALVVGRGITAGPASARPTPMRGDSGGFGGIGGGSGAIQQTPTPDVGALTWGLANEQVRSAATEGITGDRVQAGYLLQSDGSELKERLGEFQVEREPKPAIAASSDKSSANNRPERFYDTGKDLAPRLQAEERRAEGRNSEKTPQLGDKPAVGTFFRHFPTQTTGTNALEVAGVAIVTGAVKSEPLRDTTNRTEEAPSSSVREFLDRYGLKGQRSEAVTLRSGIAPSDEGTRAPSVPPVPQPEVHTSENAFSTFSLNVSDVSFRLASAALEKGALPEPGGIRIEEFINAFNYRDPEPMAGAATAFAWERARYPFAHNRDIIRFGIKTAATGRSSAEPLNLVLLLDSSGSMERADRVRIIHEALKVLATQLKPADRLSVVTFARTARLWIDGIAGDQAGKLAEETAKLTPEGGTNLEEALRIAYETAHRHFLSRGINRVVLLTDGAANLGQVDPELLKQKVEAARKQGIALDCFGIGWEGYNDDLLEALTRNGDGRYGFLNNPEQAATDFAGQLAGALKVAAADVKVQVQFNPQRVTAYRQLGYARHQLTKEQFRDNTVDAAEIGAAEAGNACYLIETDPQGQGPIATVRLRYKIPNTGEFREVEWSVPYTGAAPALSQAAPALRLAAVACAFAEWLSSSPYAGEVTPEALMQLLSGVPEQFSNDPRPKTLEWMIRQASSIAGK